MSGDSGTTTQMLIKGTNAVKMANLDQLTLYPSELITVADGAYTQHYYMGSQRIASMLGAGFKPIAGLPADPLQANATTLDNRTTEEFADANLQKLALDAQCSGTTLSSQSHTYKTPANWIYSTGYSTQDVYFYHSDHLGSSSFITTTGGYSTQHLQYMAYGEDFIHQQNASTYKTPYTFSAKEKDAETGFSYFGARYYADNLSIWLSVDPLADKFPSLSPYNYCANNPVMLVDPDGRDIVVLNYGSTRDPKHWNNHIVGHQAVLIGNDKKGWTYYSYDADEGVNGRPSKTNGNENDNFTAGVHFNSLEDFANSGHNTFKDDYDDGKGTSTSHKDNDGNIIQRFQQGYRIEADAKTDKMMKKAADATFDKKYSLIKGNQCTSVPKNALDAGGFKNGEYSDTGKRDPQNYGKTIKERNTLPVTKQKEIERSNRGIDVDNQLKRQ